MKMGWLFLVAVSALAASGCGGDDDDENPAVKKCNDFAHKWCDASAACLVMVGRVTESDAATSIGACYDTAMAAAQCKRAVSIASTYNQCLADINAMDCARWDVPQDQLSNVGVPSTCQGIVLIQ